MRYGTAIPDSADIVTSVTPGYYFECPDIASLDGNIAELLQHVGPRSNLMPARQWAARRDIDRLLDRRLYLEMTGSRAA